MSDSDYQYQYNDDPLCPYCGHKERDAWEINFGAGMEGETEITCGKCDEEYLVSRHVSVSYSTCKIKDKK